MKTNEFETPIHEIIPAKKSTGRLRRRLLPALLLLMLGGAGFGFNALLPKTLPNKAHSRAGWYVTSKQWRADARTFAAMMHYVTEREAAGSVERNLARVNECDDTIMCLPPLPQYPPAEPVLTPGRAGMEDGTIFSSGAPG